MLPDYHVHTHISPDSHAHLSEICSKAASQEIPEIAITDHFEFYGRVEDLHRNLDWTRPKRLRGDILRLREQGQYSDSLVVRFGVEIGQPHIFPALTEQLVQKNQFDFILGSLHRLGDKDLSEFQYSRDAIPHIAGWYLDELYQVVDSCDFDCLGHFDLVARYAARAGFHIDLMELYPARCEKILARLIQRGLGLELNTSGLRQPMGRCMPGEKILQCYRELGGTWVTVGSDAHRPDDIASGFEVASSLLRSTGITRIMCFSGRNKVDENPL